ncbi:two-partner secretion domain-containing protein [Leptolyngbya ectocarpi]|nr:filamentous hemagglutinin N-terminal domain-containing protein [Leptolyngbya ectocarpi]
MALSAAVCDRATAQALPQIVPDGTLGLESSELIDESPTEQLIRGGAQQQGNLFHSFKQFSIDAGHQVYFTNPTDVVRIFGRVTGSQPSDILGTLGVRGDADLFLLNPNGILFGPDAQLDVAGSFTASTANSVVFSNGNEFSAVTPTAPLLNLDVPPGVQFNTQSQPNGNLTNEADLAVGEGQTLTLFGNSVSSTVSLAAPNGNAQIVGNQVELIDSIASSISEPSGNTNLLVQAADNITVADITDNTLLFANGTGQITLEANANGDSTGNVIMLDLQDTLQTNGRDLTISGMDFVLGKIDTSVQPETHIFDVDAGGRIPPSGTRGRSTFTFTVPVEVGPITDLDVRFSAAHTHAGALSAWLSSPNGPLQLLFSQVRRGGENFQDTVFDDEASRDIGSWGSSAPFEGSFHINGVGGLAVFDGQTSEGIWTLRVLDNGAGGGSGTLFQAGDAAPWGTAQGTQLIVNSTVLAAGEGNGGAVSLEALGDIIVAEVVTAGIGVGEDGGSGGNVSLVAGGDIQVGIPASDSLINAGSEEIPGLINAAGSKDGGNGGRIQINAGGNVTSTGDIDASSSSFANLSSDSNSNSQSGNGGDISISAARDVIIAGSLSSFSNSDVDVASSLVSDLDLDSESRNGGDISISAVGDVTIAGDLFSYSNSISSSGSDLESNSKSGNGGDISISATRDVAIAGSLSSYSDSNSSTASFSEPSSSLPTVSESGNGGDISISDARDVMIAGSLFSFSDSSSFSDSVSRSDSFSKSGNGGGISISNTRDVIIEGRLSSYSDSVSDSFSPSEGGNGGDISISDARDVIIEGGLFSYSRSFSSTISDLDLDLDSKSGNGGDISISDVRDVIIEDKLFSYSSSSSNSNSSSESGNGGDISISTTRDVTIKDRLLSDSSSLSRSDSFSQSGNGGDLRLFSNLGDILTHSIQTNSYSSNTAGSGGMISLKAADGLIQGNDAEILTFAVTETGGSTGVGGDIYLEAASTISGLEIITLASGNNSGSVNIQGIDNNLTIKDLSLIISGQVQIPDPSNTDRVITLDLNNLGQSGNTHIDSTGDISLNNVNIDASANSNQTAGGVTIQTPGQLTFTNSQITSNANSIGDAGTIRLDVGQLNIGNGGRIFAATSGAGNGGNVIIDATDSVFLGEGVQDFEPVISVAASDAGRPGNIVINTPNFVLSETASITATATETATNLEEGGSISLNADEMDLSGIVRILAETQGQSPGGVLTLQPYQSNPNLDLTLASGAVVSASTTSSGNGGGLEILAPESISISGPGRLTVETSGTGRGGDIDVTSQQLRLADGVTLSASTTEAGQAGDITLSLTDSLEINNSTVTSSTEANSTGHGGNISVTAPNSALRNGGTIAVSSQGTGQGGQVTVTGDQLILADGSRISATTLSSDGGDLTFDLQDLLLLRGGSEISTTAGTAGAGGDGGDITIDSRFIVATPNENSDIAANAFDGNGGNVDITATGGLFGIEPRPERTPQNDITASSRNGVSGTVTVQTPNIDPSQDAVNLPTSPITSEVARSCRETYVQTGSEFVVTGRGGLPQGPLDSAATTLWQDVLPIAGGEFESNEQITSESEDNAAIDAGTISAPIVEVQGWTRNERGQVVLVAENPQQVAVGQPLACQG